VDELEQKALELLKEKEYDKAAKIYLQLAISTPNDETHLLSAANCYETSGEKKLAIGLYKKALEINPQSQNALIKLSTIYYQVQKYEKSEQYAKQALDTKQDNFNAIFNLGNIAYARGNYQDALEYYEKMYALNPNSYLAIVNIANSSYCLCNFFKAIEYSLMAIKKRPSNVDPYVIAGNSYMELNKLTDSVVYLKKALEISPNSPWVINSIANIFQKQEDWKQCLHFLWKSFAIKGDTATTDDHINFGHSLYEAQLDEQKELVDKYLKHWMEIYGNNPIVSYINSILTNDKNIKTSDITYVQKLFDGFASSFENVLSELNYQVPTLIADSLKSNLKTKLFKKRRILDLGCGTGLCAEAIKEHFPNEEYYGIDISERMLEIARRKNIYKELTADDINNFVTTDTNLYHAVVAGDVLTYFGDIKSLFREIARITKFNGLFCFSITTNTENNQNYYLTSSGRFIHSPNYICSMLKFCGFEVIKQEEAFLRKEGRRDINGYIILAKKNIEIVYE
jgi:predicted TPR repeat methyltransferase